MKDQEFTKKSVMTLIGLRQTITRMISGIDDEFYL